ncbi:hypothetical protein [Haloarchaeobius baliensis]|uniref:hypothetical protein n=1 Tax=Haloarchaeobius baliensis TaxID=1670458 RepID=UPI003F883AFF
MTARSRRSASRIDRRRLLKLTGATALGGAAFSGVASAHGVTDGPVFCGCSQVCVCGWGSGAEVVVATEDGDDGFDCERVWQDFDFCYEVDEGKIVAIDVEGEVYCNPNVACAGDALEDCDIDCDGDGERGGRRVSIPDRATARTTPRTTVTAPRTAGSRPERVLVDARLQGPVRG